MNLKRLIDAFRYPRHRIVFQPLTPGHLRLNDGSDLDYYIMFKKHWWSRWRFVSDINGIPEPFSKSDIENFKQIFEKQ